MAVRLVHHLTVTTPDVREQSAWYHDVLGFRTMAYIEPGPGAPWVFSVNTTNEKSHDLGFVLDFDGQRGRHHHLAFWVETNHDLTKSASFLVEHGHDIDFGPGQHGIGEQNYLYFRDPGGLRYELNSGGYRNYVPDWEPVRWGVEDGPNNTYRTEIQMPAVHMVPIPPGAAGRQMPERDDSAHPVPCGVTRVGVGAGACEQRAGPALLAGERDVQTVDAEREPHRRQPASEAPEQIVVTSAAADWCSESGVVDLEHRAGVVADVAHETEVEDDALSDGRVEELVDPPHARDGLVGLRRGVAQRLGPAPALGHVEEQGGGLLGQPGLGELVFETDEVAARERLEHARPRGLADLQAAHQRGKERSVA